MLDFMIQYLRVCDWILKEFSFFRNKVVGTKRSNKPTQEILTGVVSPSLSLLCKMFLVLHVLHDTLPILR